MKDLKIFTDNIEPEALKQIELLLEQDAFKNSKVRIMPDVHDGKGCVIGFTGDLGKKIIPNIVGVDIGCGLLTIKLGDIKLDLAKLDDVIRKHIPSGFNVHTSRQVSFPKLKEMKCYGELKDPGRIGRSIGTLGGGNHFIEVGVDKEENKYLIIHTGSRNLGKQVAEYYQNLAIKNNKDKLPRDLAYLEGDMAADYLHDMVICQEYAVANRAEIAQIICEKMKIEPLTSFETIHNYIDLKSNIVRKGAISAKIDELLLIPINMRDGCIIGRGKGNKDWNESAPHGAGRIMSRTKAKATVDLEEFKKEMTGIYTTSVSIKTIDEAPCVYKPMQEIVDHIADTVEIIRIIKPIYNFKAGDKGE